MTFIKYEMPVLLVSDIAISKHFYQDLFSLKIENDFGKNIVFRDAFSIWERRRAEDIIFQGKLEIDSNPKDIKNVELYFETNDIEKIWKRINFKEIEVIHGLKEESWGQRTLRIFDPDKYVIEVAEPMDQVVLRFIKEGLIDSEIAKKTQMSIEFIKRLRNKQ